ncbi:MAG TPA: phenylalanine--tRNA ligase subunit alpha, partial [Ignavibacteriales bacterium]|nr:phenylalanine--tRNA ligase subunit alpha [Ignavibacteriales bacterium]
MLAKKIVSVLENFRKDSSASIDLKILEEIRIKYLGRNGLVTNLFEELKSVSKEEKPALGKSLNSLRDQITSKIT